MTKASKNITVLQEKLHLLLKHAQVLIQEAKEKKPYNEGLVCLLSQTVYDLEKASDEVVQENHNEDAVIEANLVKNVLEQPLYPKQSPYKKLSMLSAAKMHKETNNTEEMKEIILACALDPKHAEVMLDDLKEIEKSLRQSN